jgi:hypothetical protein
MADGGPENALKPRSAIRHLPSAFRIADSKNRFFTARVWCSNVAAAKSGQYQVNNRRRIYVR